MFTQVHSLSLWNFYWNVWLWIHIAAKPRSKVMDYVDKVMEVTEKSVKGKKGISMTKLLGLTFRDDFWSEFLLLNPLI